VIFVTVGSQLPFDRLIRTVDEWAGSQRRSDVFAQIGQSQYHAIHIETACFVDPLEFRRRIESAKVIVAHAGMGSIISALEFGKPIIVMPRRGDLRETRNDHQIATAQSFLKQGRVIVAFDEEQLVEKLNLSDNLRGSEQIKSQASPQLISSLREFIEGKLSQTK